MYQLEQKTRRQRQQVIDAINNGAGGQTKGQFLIRIGGLARFHNRGK